PNRTRSGTFSIALLFISTYYQKVKYETQGPGQADVSAALRPRPRPRCGRGALDAPRRARVAPRSAALRRFARHARRDHHESARQTTQGNEPGGPRGKAA